MIPFHEGSRAGILLGFCSGKLTPVLQVMAMPVPGMVGSQLLNRAQQTPFGTHLPLVLPAQHPSPLPGHRCAHHSEQQPREGAQDAECWNVAQVPARALPEELQTEPGLCGAMGARSTVTHSGPGDAELSAD